MGPPNPRDIGCAITVIMAALLLVGAIVGAGAVALLVMP